MSASTYANGTVSLAELQDRLSSYPGYKDTRAHERDRAKCTETLWGGRMAAIMAGKNTTGRYAGAHLECPDTACTGLIELNAYSHSMTYANVAAIENILALEDGLEVKYGVRQNKIVLLNRFDMVSIPVGLSHSLHNRRDGKLPMVSILNAGSGDGYAAVFSVDAGVNIPEQIAHTLQISLGNIPEADETIDLETRVTRFKKLVPYKKQLSSSSGIPPEATEMLSADSVFPLIVPEGHVGRSSAAPMNGLPGLYLSIARCAGGAQDGPPPHAHTDTQETFFVLDGEWDISSGFNNENTVTAKPFDIIPMPSNVMRAFQNRSDRAANLFVIIQGKDKMSDTILFSDHYGEVVRDRFGEQTIDAYRKINMQFNAEERLLQK